MEEPVARLLTLSLIPMLATSLGALFVLFKRGLEERFIDIALGFGAGMMLYVSFAELLLPSMELGGPAIALAGFVSGAAAIKALDALLPHARIVREGGQRSFLLLSLAVIIHNIPEGLAVGAASLYGASEGFAVSTSVAIQDIPEGYIVALSVALIYGSALRGVLAGLVSALSEYSAALLALLGLIDLDLALPLMLSFSAAAMIYVVVHEISPEIFGHEHDDYATAGLLLGLLAGMSLGLLGL